MKTPIAFFIGFLLLMLNCNASNEIGTDKDKTSPNGTLNIKCTPDLYNLTSVWASEYNKLHPESGIRVERSTFENPESTNDESLGFISGISIASLNNEANWKIVVGRDVIAPIMNSQNPFLNEIAHQGISQENFARIFNNPEVQNWGTILKNDQNAPINIFIVNDETTKDRVAKFLQESRIPVTGINFGTKEEVISAIRNDPYAIGFCKTIDVLDADNKSLVEGIQFLPIDKNGNGSLDYMENIYGDISQFFNGVWIGKYPKALYNNIYAVSKVQPTRENELSFLSWVVSSGQQYMNNNGYCDLVKTESQSLLDKINVPVINTTSSGSVYPQIGLALLILAVIISIGISINLITRRSARRKINYANATPAGSGSFDENSLEIPKGLYFDKTHTWAFMEKNGNVSIGLDDFIQHITGPITRIEMKEPGEKIKKGELLFSIIQSGKQLNMYSPVSGTIKHQNEALRSESSFLNRSPYTEGWVYLIEPDNWINEIRVMDVADKYKRWLSSEFLRLKDFLAARLRSDSVEFSHIVLQDGGVLKDGVLSDFGPEIWDDFQTHFMDTYQ